MTGRPEAGGAVPPCLAAGRGAGEGGFVVVASYAAVSDVVDVGRARLARGEAVVVELSGPGCVDLALLDTLARLALDARRFGGALLVRAATPDLPRLAELCGLSAVLAVGPESAQPRRQAQALEERGAEEVVDVRDPSP